MDITNATDADDVEGSDIDIFDNFDSFSTITTTMLAEIVETEDYLPAALISKELLPKINARSGARSYERVSAKPIIDTKTKAYLADIIIHKKSGKYHGVLGVTGGTNSEICVKYG